MNTAIKIPSVGQRLSADYGRSVARAINSLRITGGPGVRVTQGPNGVTISAAARTATASTATALASFPLKLSITTDATARKSYLCVMYNDGSVQVLGGGNVTTFATSGNNDVATVAERGWKYVAGAFAFDASTNATKATDLGALNDYAWDADDPSFDVDVLVYEAGENANGTKKYSAVVMTNGDYPATLPIDSIVAYVYIGTVECVTDADTKVQTYNIRNQVVRDSLVVRKAETEETNFPFRLSSVNEGTADEPEWKAIVYLPTNAVQSSTQTATVTNNLTAVTNRDGWYYVSGTAATDGNTIYLVCTSTTVVDKENGAWSDEYLTFSVSRDRAQTLTEPTFSRAGENYSYRFNVIVGTADALTGATTNILRSGYAADGWYLAQIDNDVTAVSRDLTTLENTVNSMTGGGGGTLVSMTDNRTDYTASGILGVTQASAIANDSTSTSGQKYASFVNISVNDGIGAGKVILEDDTAESKPKLNDYLKGGKNTNGVAYGYGENVTTSNFADKCLPDNSNSDVVTGTATLAARSDHKHYAEDIYQAGETVEDDVSIFSSLTNYTNYLISIGALPDPNDTTTPAQTLVPCNGQFVTFGDLTTGFPATQGATGIGDDTSGVPLQDSASTTAGLGENVLSETYLQQAGIEQGEWTRSSDASGKGFKYTICCGVHYVPEKYGVFLIYREVSVDKYGMIYHVSKAKFGLYYPITT